MPVSLSLRGKSSVGGLARRFHQSMDAAADEIDEVHLAVGVLGPGYDADAWCGPAR